MKNFTIAIFCIFPSMAFAQNVGIGTIAPDENLQVDSIIHIGKNQVIPAGSSRKNLIRFGDQNYVTIGEQDKDDYLVLKASNFNFSNGAVGIGIDSAREKLDVNGAVKIGFTNSNNQGTLRFNNTTNDIEFRDNTSWNAVKNRFFNKEVTSLFSENVNTFVDFPTTDITVPENGTYLITYFIDAYNNFTLSGTPAQTVNKLTYSTEASIWNKTANSMYQRMKIDFLNNYVTGTGAGAINHYNNPAHAVSGSIAKTLTAGERIGVKMYQTADSEGGGRIAITNCSITLVRLF